MRRILLVLTVAAMMALIMVAAPALSSPGDPYHGAKVSDTARLQPSDPYSPTDPYIPNNPNAPSDPYHGYRVTKVALPSDPYQCELDVDFCPQP
jgi:hypothetical protein